MGNGRTKVRSLETTFRVIDALAEFDLATTSELADHLDLAQSTVHNHLSTLKAHEYVTGEDGKYRLGYRFLELGGRVRSRSKLYAYGRPKVDDLAEETGEVVNLMVEEHGKGSLIYLSKGSDAVAFDTHAGNQYYLHCNALGKTILSQLPAEDIEEIVDRHGLPSRTDNTITEKEELYDELAEIRDRGYAFDDEERIDGLRCVAAPIKNENGLHGSISISGPATRLKGDRFREEFPDSIVQTADMIGIEMAYSDRGP